MPSSVQEEIERPDPYQPGQPVVIHGAGPAAASMLLAKSTSVEGRMRKITFARCQTPEDIDFISVEQKSDDLHSHTMVLARPMNSWWTSDG